MLHSSKQIIHHHRIIYIAIQLNKEKLLKVISYYDYLMSFLYFYLLSALRAFLLLIHLNPFNSLLLLSFFFVFYFHFHFLPLRLIFLLCFPRSLFYFFHSATFMFPPISKVPYSSTPQLSFQLQFPQSLYKYLLTERFLFLLLHFVKLVSRKSVVFGRASSGIFCSFLYHSSYHLHSVM